MSRINSLRLRVTHLGSPEVTRTVYLLGKPDEGRFQVSWGEKSPTAAPSRPLSYLEMADWKPASLELIFSSGQKSKTIYYLQNEAPLTSWRKITPFVLRQSYAEGRETSHFADEDTHPGSHGWRVDEAGSFLYARGYKFYHASMAEVIERYTDPFNAVRIEPGSWLDNKLQEAYYSRRKKPDKGETHE